MSGRIAFPAHAWPLMKRALEHIAAHPDEFYMPEFVVRSDYASAAAVLSVEDHTGLPFPSCGTVACLAGRIALEGGEDPETADDMAALRLLGITSESPAGDRLERLFYRTGIDTYAELAAALEREFTFPEPLPAVRS